MVFFGLTTLAVVRVASRFGIGALPATIVTLFACLGQGVAAKAWVNPWTTTLAAAVIWWMIVSVLAIVLPLDSQKPPQSRIYSLLGLLAAMLALTRPADAVISAACVFLVGATLMIRKRLKIGPVVQVLAGGLVITIPYMLLHLAIYGPHLTSYMKGTSDAGFVLADLPFKAYTLLVSAEPWYPDTRSMIEAMPWLLPAAGGTLLLLAKPGPARAPLLIALAIATPYTLFYCVFSDLVTPGLWEYGNVHYFKWMFPLAGLMLWVWLRTFASWRGAANATLALLVAILPTTIRALPVPIASDRAARLLLFHGDTARVWNEAYFAPVWVIDPQGKQMHNIGGFHQIPDPSGERAIAIQRLFAPGTVRDDPAETSNYPQPQVPYARYGTALSVGLPCWLDHAGCRMPPPPKR